MSYLIFEVYPNLASRGTNQILEIITPKIRGSESFKIPTVFILSFLKPKPKIKRIENVEHKTITAAIKSNTEPLSSLSKK